MTITDSVYGKHTINSPVLLSLIASTPLQRLKGIAQYGVPDEYYHLKNFSRYEHCVGVMLLLKMLGASEEEQIVGLLHDVSHTAFSHVIDWVIGSGRTEGYQDSQHESYVQSSEIPQILETYGYDAERITDYHHFGLLERDLPDLCADRLDYSLREFPKAIAKRCVAALSTKKNKIVFKDRESALLFGRNFLKRQIEHWGGFEAASRYRIFANMLRFALHKQIIVKDDFWQDDEFIIRKVEESKEEEIQKALTVLRLKSWANLPKSDIVVHKKFRYVDSLFLNGEKLSRASEVDSMFKKEIEHARLKNDEGITIPLV